MADLGLLSPEMTMELTGEQLKRYLPQSLPVYSYLVRLNRSHSVGSETVKVLVDRWPDFSVFVCKPQYEQMGNRLKVTVFFANNEAIIEEAIRTSSASDWPIYLFVGVSLRLFDTIRAVAPEKDVPSTRLAFHTMMLEGVSRLPSIDSSGITLSALNESHAALVHQKWKYGRKEESVRMIRDMITSFPSCCVLDAEAKPVSWILTYEYGALGMMYTLPEHRGKGYAKVLISTMAKRFHADRYPVYCFVEEGNEISYRLLTSLGFTEDPSYRSIFVGMKHL